MMLVEGIASLFVFVSGSYLIHRHTKIDKRKSMSFDSSQTPFKFGFINSVILLSFTLITALVSNVFQTPEGSIVFFIVLVMLALALVVSFIRIETRKIKRYMKNQNAK